ncbi:MAG: DUF2442 domain-containing protein [Flavobacteriales bacterium]
MNTSTKKATDPFDKLIFEYKLRAKQLTIYKDLDMMIVVFNNGKLIKLRISDYPRLKKATKKQLSNWKLIGGGIGIRWEELDEDLSIKGFIKTAALNNMLRNLQDQGSDERIVA